MDAKEHYRRERSVARLMYGLLRPFWCGYCRRMGHLEVWELRLSNGIVLGSLRQQDEWGLVWGVTVIEPSGAYGWHGSMPLDAGKQFVESHAKWAVTGAHKGSDDDAAVCG